MGLLRTLFAISVVLDHLAYANGYVLVGGRLAVQLFYVISGFLISYILVSTAAYQDTGKFYQNRILRLFPIYLVVAALALAAHAAWNPAFFDMYRDMPRDAAVLLALSNLFIFGQDWVMFMGVKDAALAYTGNFNNSDIPLYEALLVPQAWTLGVELSFYLVAPLFIRSLRGVVLLFAASMALRLLLIMHGAGRADPWTYRFFPTELALFLLGALSHRVLLPRCEALCKRFSYLPETVTALCVAYVLCNGALPLNHNVRDGLALLLFAAVLPFTFIHQARHPLDRKLGELSYPVYISHLLVIQVLAQLPWLADKQGTTFAALTVAGTLALAVALNTVVAHPIELIRRRVKSGARAMPAPAGGLAHATATLGTLPMPAAERARYDIPRNG